MKGLKQAVDSKTLGFILSHIRNDARMIEGISREFARLLTVYVGIENMYLVVDKNREGDPEVCATHDFCDANVFMAEALKVAGIYLDDDYPEFFTDDEHGAVLIGIWNDAWKLAKSEEFYMPKQHFDIRMIIASCPQKAQEVLWPLFQQYKLASDRNAERLWEQMMMELVGEDGLGSVREAITKMKNKISELEKDLFEATHI